MSKVSDRNKILCVVPVKDKMRKSSLCRSPWRGTVYLWLFIILIQLSDYCYGQSLPTYMSYDILSDRICNRYSKREVDATYSRPVILEMSPDSRHEMYTGATNPKQCEFQVESRGGFRHGLVAVVQKMNFRNYGDACVDYIQSIRKPIKGLKNKEKKDKFKIRITKRAAETTTGGIVKRGTDEDQRGPRICGDVMFGLLAGENDTLPQPFAMPLPPTPPPPTPVRADVYSSVHIDSKHINRYESIVTEVAEVDPKGKLKMQLFISNRPLRINEEPAKLKIVYTVYQECDGRRVPDTLFHCGYGLCIHNSLVNDGFVNCPFGDCIDETNCTNAKNAKISAHILWYSPYSSYGGAETGGTIGGLLSFLVLCGGCGCCYYYCCRRKRAQKNQTPVTVEEDKDAEPSNQPQPNTYCPTQPTPNAAPPPGGQPGYYPMVPLQQPPPPGYTQQPGQQPPGYPGMPPPQGGYPGQPQNPGGQYPGQAPSGYPPMQQQPASNPGYLPPTSSEQPPQSGTIGFNLPPLPAGGYPPAPTPGAPYEAPTAPPH